MAYERMDNANLMAEMAGMNQDQALDYLRALGVTHVDIDLMFFLKSLPQLDRSDSWLVRELNKLLSEVVREKTELSNYERGVVQGAAKRLVRNWNVTMNDLLWLAEVYIAGGTGDHPASTDAIDVPDEVKIYWRAVMDVVTDF